MGTRTIDVEVDQASWKGSIPNDITALASKKSVSLSVEVALLITALITRPPEIRGFSLADSWAWLRYRPALTETSDLRLKSEWKDIDPHQKMILSDELGMGFTTCILTLELDFRIIANTLYFVRVVAPSSYYLKASTKTGPRKSPDFVALDSHDRVNAFECKGTQQSKASLLDLTSNGVAQKSNLSGSAGSALHHTLVAGLFIPQFTTREDALIYIRDPKNIEFDQLLKTVSHEQQKIAIVQIDLAKHFALMGLQSIANALALRAVENNTRLPAVDNEEWTGLGSDANDIFLFRTDIRLPSGTLTISERDVTGMTFSMTCPRDSYFGLINSRDLNSELLRFADLARQHKWVITESEWSTTLTTPLGFNLTLSYLVQPQRS